MTNSRIFQMSIATVGLALIAFTAINKYQDGTPTSENAMPEISGEIKHTELFATLTNKTQPQDAEEIINLQEKVLLLSKEVAQLRLELNNLKKGNALKTPATTEVQSPEEHRKSLFDPSKQMDAELNRREEIAAIESAFHAEPRNSQWAAEVTSQIHGLLDANQIPQANLHTIECHSKTCRVEFSTKQTDSIIQTLPPLFAQLSPSMPTMTTDQIDVGNGALTTVLYLSSTP